MIVHTRTQIVGMALLGIGIYLQVETAIDNLGLSGLLSNPAIILIIIGSVLFLLGFCGCFGALLELFFLLVIVRTLHVPQEAAVYILATFFTSAVCSCVVPYSSGGDRGGGMGVCAAGPGQCVVRMFTHRTR